MTPRGIRNKNPGNIRHGSKWRGLAEVQNDPDFCVFDCPTYGIRALCRILLVYQWTYRLKTIKAIISRYAPTIENNTNAYAEHVAQQTGFGVDQEIDVTDPTVMVALVKAIILHENGEMPYTWEIADGLLLAGIS